MKGVLNLDMNRNQGEVKTMKRWSGMTIATFIAASALLVGLAFAQGGGGMGGGGMGGGGTGAGGMGGGGMGSGGMGGGSMGAGGTHGSMQSPEHQPMMGQGMADNMAMMSEVMNEMHQMMTGGKMTQEQQMQMMDMMNQMGTMMQQMAGPKGSAMDKEQNTNLHEMEQRLEIMKGQMARQ